MMRMMAIDDPVKPVEIRMIIKWKMSGKRTDEKNEVA